MLLKKGIGSILCCLLLFCASSDIYSGDSRWKFTTAKKWMYHEGWIDCNKNGQQDPFEDPRVAVEERITDLLGRMTLEEKTCQMATLYGFGRVVEDELPTPEWKERIWKDGIGNIDEHLNGLDRPACQTEYSWPPSDHVWARNEVQKFFVEETRLGIPVDFTNEGIRGVCHEGGTNFPAQIGVGSTWDVDLVSLIGHVTGEEARLLGYTNIYSPILDLARDPRWGRAVECYGEDPHHVSQLGMAQVRALQSEGVVSTPKHFAVYSIPKGGRDGMARTDPHVAPREMETVYLAPFRSAFLKAGALGVMSSYNDYDGIPVSGSRYFLMEKLREEWGFRGYVVSDSRAVDFIYSKHHVAPDYKEAVRQSVEAGLNVRTNFTFPEVFIDPLRELVREGRLSMQTVDARVRDVLRVKFWLGLFDRPYAEDPRKADEIVGCEAHQALALRASRESIVLLKNQGDVLPLKKTIRSILVTGPNAASTDHSISRYGPNKVEVISILEGIRNLLPPEVEVKYAEGCALVDSLWPESEILPVPPSADEQAEIDKAVSLAKAVDVAVVVLGGSGRTTGESFSRTSLDLPGYQDNLVKAVFQTGTPTIVVLINGRPLSINWIDRYAPAIVEAWFPGSWGGQAVAEVLFGDYNPGGKLPVTFPKTVGQIPLNFPYKPGSHAGTSSYAGKGARVQRELYPFGHGLSYTQFEYSDLRIQPKTQGPGGEYRVEFHLKNIGQRTGDEVVQLYVNDEVSSVTTHTQVLRGFRRVTLEPGVTETVAFKLDPEDLMLLNRHGEWEVEPGIFEIRVGSSSRDIRLTDRIHVVP